MKLDTKALITKISPLLDQAKRYTTLIFIIVLCGVYGFLAYRINSLTQAEPAPEAITEKLKTVSRPRIDQNAVDKMTKLEQENVEVKSLFQAARNNPFSE